MKHCLLFLLLLTSLKSFSQDLEHDRLALVALFNSTGGPRWYSQESNAPNPWIVPGNPGDNPCGWFGITCEGGRITEVVLNDNELNGSIPAEIGNLTALKVLSLHGSEGLSYPHPPLTGVLPLTLGNLVNLETLDISDNVFEQTNSTVIFTLPKLKSLSYSPFWPVSPLIGNLTNLENLSIVYNGQRGIPGDKGHLPAQIGNLTKLTSLTIANLELSGSIPEEFGNLINLKTLVIHDMTSAGPIPESIGNLINLESLTLSNNKHTGTIPASFNNLGKLKGANVSSNALVGPIPNLSALKLRSILAGKNNFTFDGFETNFGQFSYYDDQKHLKITKSQGLLSVNAGGTMANNTYKWYLYGSLVQTKIGDNTFTPTESGGYHVEITNSMATRLTLVSETYQNALPVTLVSFAAKTSHSQNTLTWKTTSETSNKGFEIEKSADARTFETIGFVDGKGDTNEDKTYQFTDSEPFSITYYRLKQLDHDGRFEHSKIIMVKQSGNAISIYPNPAQNHLTISGLQDQERVSILNQNGILVSNQLTDAKGNIDTENLSNGIYSVKIGNEAKKLLIQK